MAENQGTDNIPVIAGGTAGGFLLGRSAREGDTINSVLRELRTRFTNPIAFNEQEIDWMVKNQVQGAYLP